MARQKPPSKAGAFWRAINVREDLAHGSAQGFVLERSAKRGVKSFAPLRGKPPYGAPKAPVESGGFLARHKCTRRPRARQCAGIRARAEREARSEELCPLAGQASLWREAAAEQALLGTAVSLFAWRAVRKRRRTSRTTERRDSCSSEAKSFAPLRGKPPYGAPNITEPLKGRKNKERIRQIQRQRKDRKAKFGYGITVSLFAWRVVRKRRRTSRAAARRDSCSSGARSAKAAAGNDERAFVRVLSEKEREARKPRQGMTPLKRCDIIDVWSIAFRTYTDTMSCSAA